MLYSSKGHWPVAACHLGSVAARWRCSPPWSGHPWGRCWLRIPPTESRSTLRWTTVLTSTLPSWATSFRRESRQSTATMTAAEQEESSRNLKNKSGNDQFFFFLCGARNVVVVVVNVVRTSSGRRRRYVGVFPSALAFSFESSSIPSFFSLE